jgi:hypothetical protein
MTKSRRTGRSRRSADHIEIRIRPHRALWVQLLLAIWRWRIEILAVAALLLVFGHLSERLGSPRIALVGMAAPVAAVLVIPVTRRFSVSRAWCVITRHRLRACLVQIRTTNWDGRLPWILWTRPTPVGERVWLWMLPGLSIREIEERTEHIAAACWARDARIERVRRLATLVQVDVIRRDPLGTPTPIRNPLMTTTRRLDKAKPAQVIPIQNRRRATAASAKARTLTTNPAPAPSDGPRLLHNGEDVSDYV